MPVFYNKIDASAYLTGLDWLVFGLACCLCLSLILYGNRTKKSTPDVTNNAHTSLLEYLLMGRQLTLPLFISTLAATWYGNIFGVTQIAFEQGIYNLVTQGIFWYITYIVFAIYLVKKIRSYDATSLPELVKNIYGKKSAKLTAILVFFKTLPITYAMSIGLLLQCFLPLSLFQATSVGVSVIVLYAVSGGLRTIVYSDVALFIIMCFGVGLVLLCSVATFGGLGFLQNNLPSSYFRPCGTNTLPTTLVWFLIACTTTFISPSFYQRCMAAASNRVATQGILISTLIWFMFDICTTFGAMYAKAVIPETESLYAYITYGIQLLPVGFRGLLLASIAAAIIAALDSFLFIASNILMYDFPIVKFNSLKLQHAASILITALLTILISIFFDGRVESAWLICKSYFSACLLLPILFGYFSPIFANDKLFISNCILSCLSITIWRLYLMQYNPGIDAFYIGCITTCIVFACYYLANSFVAKIKASQIPGSKAA
jgi:SSS family solute:Na+ symporter